MKTVKMRMTISASVIDAIRLFVTAAESLNYVTTANRKYALGAAVGMNVNCVKRRSFSAMNAKVFVAISALNLTNDTRENRVPRSFKYLKILFLFLMRAFRRDAGR